MVNFRRNFIEGGTYFFTVALRDRKSDILTENIDLLRESFKTLQRKAPLIINAVVILPDHLHTVMTLPEADMDYPRRWKLLKSQFVRLLKKRGYQLEKDHRGEHTLWQRRYWEHTIRDDHDYENHVNYIHYNPVKHGLVDFVKDWPFSSFHRFVSKGLLPSDWGGSFVVDDGVYGE